MSLTEEQRRTMIRDAGKPKKGHHWAVLFDCGSFEICERKTLFASSDGALVCHRADTDLYRIVDRDTGAVFRTIESRNHAKCAIEMLGPNWHEVVRRIIAGDANEMRRVVLVFEKIMFGREG